jgi:hypothetical protein
MNANRERGKVRLPRENRGHCFLIPDSGGEDRATALAFAREGASVVSGRRDHVGVALVTELRALGAEADSGDGAET